MPEIEITEDQRDRLRAVQESLESDVVGKYGHVRASDALEYLLDRYEADAAADGADAGSSGGGTGADAGSSGGGTGADAGSSSGGTGADIEEAESSDGDEDGGSDVASGGDDATLDAMMNLLDEHDDKWRESSADENRYEVELPDGSTEGARTKDDVRGLLFRHYR